MDYTYRVKAFTAENESDYADTTVNFWQDCDGEWGGSAVEDCNGDCDGTAFDNECGCVGGNTGLEEGFCYGCTDPEASNYDPYATIDDGSCSYITVTSPNGGEIWALNSTHTITWTSENLSSTYITLQLYKNGNYYQTIVDQSPDDGSYLWSSSGGSDSESEYYQIKIVDYNDSGSYDLSDDYFTLELPVSLTGTWTVWWDWSCDDSWQDATITFYADGTFQSGAYQGTWSGLGGTVNLNTGWCYGESISYDASFTYEGGTTYYLDNVVWGHATGVIDSGGDYDKDGVTELFDQ